MDFDWKSTLATVAPTIATALGGPLAGVAVNIAAGALGIDADEKALQHAVAAGDPQVLVALKTAEHDFVVKLEELGVERERISVGDRDSARQLFRVDKRPQIMLSALFIVGYFIILGLLLSGTVQIPQGLKEVIILLLGIMTREIPTIMQFWFGSSSGSKDKQDMDWSEMMGRVVNFKVAHDR